jgi:hypothetical protein
LKRFMSKWFYFFLKFCCTQNLKTLIFFLFFCLWRKRCGNLGLENYISSQKEKIHEFMINSKVNIVSFHLSIFLLEIHFKKQFRDLLSILWNWKFYGSLDYRNLV